MINEVLKGENRLLYTYGVTNSGKTYTIQGQFYSFPETFSAQHLVPLLPYLSFECHFTGSGQEAGLLPRALVSLFRKLQGRLYSAMDLKPVMSQDVRQLDSSEVKMEEIRKNSLLKEVNRNGKNGAILRFWHVIWGVYRYWQDENLTSRRAGTTTVWDSGVGGLSSTTQITTQLEGEEESHVLTSSVIFRWK